MPAAAQPPKVTRTAIRAGYWVIGQPCDGNHYHINRSHRSNPATSSKLVASGKAKSSHHCSPWLQLFKGRGTRHRALPQPGQGAVRLPARGTARASRRGGGVEGCVIIQG